VRQFFVLLKRLVILAAKCRIERFYSVQKQPEKIFIPKWVINDQDGKESLPTAFRQKLPKIEKKGDDRSAFENAWKRSCKYLKQHFGVNSSFGQEGCANVSFFKKESATAWRSALKHLEKEDFEALLYIPVRTRYDSKVPKQTLEDLYSELSKDGTVAVTDFCDLFKTFNSRYNYSTTVKI